MQSTPTQFFRFLPNLSRLFILFFAFSFATISFGQSKFDPSVIAINHLRTNAAKWHLTSKDFAEAKIQYVYTTQHNGVTHVYLTQELNGIEIFNAVANVNILPSGEVLLAYCNFIPDAKSFYNAPTLDADAALVSAAKHLEVKPLGSFQVANNAVSKTKFEFLPNGIANQNIPVRLKYYQNTTTGNLHLAWNADIEMANSDDYWSLFVDAQTGEILHKHNYTIKCQFHDHAFQNIDADCREPQTPPSVKTENLAEKAAEKPTETLNGGTYRVFPFPAESPQTSGHVLVSNAVDPIASPFGWHDTTLTTGTNLSITRGNNVHAFIDWVNNGRPSILEPNGGAGLMFDFPFNPRAAADDITNAATTNLFYANNYIHDITTRLGFTEDAGNFQYKNLNFVGRGNDHVSARAQAGAKAANPLINNATFATPADGFSGIMRMYLWARSGALTPRHLDIRTPASIASTVQTSYVVFSPPITPTALNGEMVLFADTSSRSTEACFRSRTSLAGKIAVIDLPMNYTATCSPALKVLNAQDSGAIAVILCTQTPNYTPVISDTSFSLTSRVRIPVLGVNLTDAGRIKNALRTDTVRVSIVRPASDSSIADFIDGDFENGIITHEFGHGISNRLTGGPMNVACLPAITNTSGLTEQMGEGWSDFFALALTAKRGDRGEMRRAMGPYVLRQNADGRGIRRYYYSTDMSINPQSFDSIYTSQASPHPIGEIWCSTLWDLYWKMSDKYGWDANLRNFNSGNARAVRLVMDGMKMQPCLPGFVEGRDAILAADRAAYNGENQCLIWEVFARRGIGFGTDGGSSVNAGDNIESRRNLPTCIKTVKVDKRVTPNINAGQSIDVEIRVYNHKDSAVTNVTIKDIVPTGAQLVAASVSRPHTLAGNTISITLDSIRRGDSAIVRYTLSTSPTKISTNIWADGFETSPANFATSGTNTTKLWRSTNTDTLKYAGNAAMVVVGDVAMEQVLTQTNNITVSGRQPILRFFHRYVTEGGQDAGVVEISEGTSLVWTPLHTQMFRQPARGLTFGTYPLRPVEYRAFYGNSRGYTSSYVDLKDYVGKSVRIRFRFRSNLGVTSYWAVDNVQYMDMENYESQATVTTAQRDSATSVIEGRGSIVEPSFRIATKELGDLKVEIAPNPTSNLLTVNVNTQAEAATLVLTTIEGKELMRQKVAGQSTTPLSMMDFAAGLYFLTVESDGRRLVQKVVKQ
jgi:extracellular elastinolytic metalloproteinase